ncbi:MAG: DUF4398 domain-containing protein [candidate division KSB1 bacterium]|nr:DUF4398 domain-containing protein [candidate division KSB1 bacterium]MDZ7365422.1 DUF4398 domain-containing protein [candidate division KSB1 bacterium]MDZ7403531.1 DUF4398 domain-containing protein [candidate division KSB1 bacterium]
MRAELSHAARRLITAGAAMVALFFVACADSPTDQLNRAENLLAELKSNGAEAYLKYELAGARQKLEEAKKFIRKNRFDLASEYLSSVCSTLDSCSVVFVQMRQDAEQKCQQMMVGLSSTIETLSQKMTSLPRQSYIDQNRYDIYTHRLRRFREEMGILEKLFAQQDFTTALQRSYRLDFQVKQSLTGLLSVEPIPERVTQKTMLKEELPKPFAASSGRPGSH